jgi:hypothetical protein
MESNQFDALTRALSTRRTTITGLLGGSFALLLGLGKPEEAGAHDPAAACRKLPDLGQRRRCRARARRHKRRQHTCRPQPKAVTCAGRCGRFRNNCRKGVDCTCPADQTCFANGTCSRVCTAGGTGTLAVSCPAGCDCEVDALEGGRHCVSELIETCTQVPIVCTSTAQCPVGHVCSTPVCNGESRCFPVCQQ